MLPALAGGLRAGGFDVTTVSFAEPGAAQAAAERADAVAAFYGAPGAPVSRALQVGGRGGGAVGVAGESFGPGGGVDGGAPGAKSRSAGPPAEEEQKPREGGAGGGGRRPAAGAQPAPAAAPRAPAPAAPPPAAP